MNNSIESGREAAVLSVVSCRLSNFTSKSFVLKEGLNSIGRLENCDVCLPYEYVSKIHAFIEIEGRHHMLVDNNSDNKTHLQRLCLKPFVRYHVGDGDVIKLADMKLIYRYSPKLIAGAGNFSDSVSTSMNRTDELLSNRDLSVSPNLLNNELSTKDSSYSGCQRAVINNASSRLLANLAEETPAPRVLGRTEKRRLSLHNHSISLHNCLQSSHETSDLDKIDVRLSMSFVKNSFECESTSYDLHTAVDEALTSHRAESSPRDSSPDRIVIKPAGSTVLHLLNQITPVTSPCRVSEQNYDVNAEETQVLEAPVPAAIVASEVIVETQFQDFFTAIDDVVAGSTFKQPSDVKVSGRPKIEFERTLPYVNGEPIVIDDTALPIKVEPVALPSIKVEPDSVNINSVSPGHFLNVISETKVRSSGRKSKRSLLVVAAKLLSETESVKPAVSRGRPQLKAQAQTVPETNAIKDHVENEGIAGVLSPKLEVTDSVEVKSLSVGKKRSRQSKDRRCMKTLSTDHSTSIVKVEAFTYNKSVTSDAKPKRSRRTGSVSGHNNLVASASFDNNVKRCSTLKPKIMFTGIKDTSNQAKIVTMLGGVVEQSVVQCTHLVTDNMKRTVKFMCAIARGIFILSTKWLDESIAAKCFLAEEDYILNDIEAEKHWNFSLRGTLQISRTDPLLSSFIVHATKSVEPEPAQWKDIVSCAGGKYAERIPALNSGVHKSVLIVSAPEDEALCKKAAASGVPIISSDALLTALLRHKLDLETQIIPSGQQTSSLEMQPKLEDKVIQKTTTARRTSRRSVRT